MHCVVCFTYGMSLRKWEAAGILERELAIYHRLSDRGVRVTLLTYGDRRERRYLPRIAPLEIASNDWGLPRSVYAWGLPWLHRRLWASCDLIKTNQMEGADVACRAARQAGKPWIARGGFLWADTVARLLGAQHPAACRARAEENRGFATASRIVVTTSTMASEVARRFPGRCDDIRVLPNYVDTGLFRPHRPTGSPVDLVFAGRLAREKNLPVLLQALRDTNWRLLVIGDGPLRASWQAEYADLSAQVIWQGKVPNHELPSQLARAQLFILPSLFEGQPKIVLEAMACGLPVVVADRPGLRDVVEHGRTGWLFDGSSAGLVAAICHLQANPDTCRHMAEQARREVIGRCALDHVVDQERQLYEEVTSSESCKSNGLEADWTYTSR